MKRLSRFSGSPKPILSEQEPPQPATKTVIEQRSVDEGRPLRVVVIGAGISGILACIRFVQRIPNLDLCIYDKNADIGGTWFENRYPGCACEWSSFYATSPEIHRYWKRIVDKYGCMKYIKLKQQIEGATWDGENSKWHIQIRDTDNSLTFPDHSTSTYLAETSHAIFPRAILLAERRNQPTSVSCIRYPPIEICRGYATSPSDVRRIDGKQLARLQSSRSVREGETKQEEERTKHVEDEGCRENKRREQVESQRNQIEEHTRRISRFKPTRGFLTYFNFGSMIPSTI